jgi:HEAT repeat protein
MLTPVVRIAVAAALGASSAGVVRAQQPPVLNGRVTTVAARAPFAQSFRNLVSAQAEAGWIGYTVPVIDRSRESCCNGQGGGAGGDGTWSACRLEAAAAGSGRPASDQTGTAIGAVQLEGSERLAVLFRVEAGAVERIRTIPGDCVLDAGGRPVQWIEGVRPPDSVALLEAFAVDTGGRNSVADGAIAAIALHRDESADVALERLAGTNHPDAIRKKVTFWLGNARGRRGFDALRTIMRDDPSLEVRKAAVFGLAQSSVPEGTDALVSVAKTDNAPVIRGEALFWLAQKAGRKAADAITDRIAQDPDTDVKKKAVFALSQLPKDEGVPLLITVARTNTNPAVRKQAMFWLGQSKDPRAIDFFAQVLK